MCNCEDVQMCRCVNGAAGITIQLKSFLKFIIKTMKGHLLLLLFMTTVSVEGQVTFQKMIYNGGNSSYSGNLTNEGGYIIMGTTQTFGAGTYDFYLVKTDLYGEIIWTRTYGGIGAELGTSIKETIAGGYIIAGYAQGFGAGAADVYLVRTDDSGNLLWSKTFGGTSDDRAADVQQTNDGGFIITGYTQSFNITFGNFYLIKTDSLGNLMWTKTYSGASLEGANSVEQTTDGGYIITGLTYSFGAGQQDVLLIKTDSAGNPIWSKTFGGAFYEYGSSVKETLDGGFIIAGRSNSFNGNGNDDMYLIKTDINGDTLWTKILDRFQDQAFTVQQTSDGGYIIGGVSNSDDLVIKTDASGDIIWSKVFNGYQSCAFSVFQTADNGYAIIGGSTNIYLIKTDSIGNSWCNENSPVINVASTPTQISSPSVLVTTPNTIVTNPTTIVGSGGIDSTLCTSVGVNEINTGFTFVISPNPTGNLCRIYSEQCTIETVEVYNFIGERMHNIAAINCGLWTVDCRLLSPGIYFINVISENGRAIQKLVVQR